MSKVESKLLESGGRTQVAAGQKNHVDAARLQMCGAFHRGGLGASSADVSMMGSDRPTGVLLLCRKSTVSSDLDTKNIPTDSSQSAHVTDSNAFPIRNNNSPSQLICRKT